MIDPPRLHFEDKLFGAKRVRVQLNEGLALDYGLKLFHQLFEKDQQQHQLLKKPNLKAKAIKSVVSTTIYLRKQPGSVSHSI